MAITLRLSYYPWITQHIAASDVRRWINEFATELGDQLTALAGKPYWIEVQQPVEVPRQIKMIAEGGSEIALMNPLGFLFANQRNAKVEAVAVALRKIDGSVGHTYYAQLYTNRKTRIRFNDDKGNIDERGRAVSRGRALGFGVAYSTSNFLIPAFHLVTVTKISPLAYFGRVEFIGGHDSVAKAVYDGRIDVGAGHDGVIDDLADQYGYGDAKDRLVRLARTDPITSDPIAVNIPDDTLRKHVVQALINTGASKRGKDALFNFWGKVEGLAAMPPNPYDNLTKALSTLQLTQDDLLPPA